MTKILLFSAAIFYTLLIHATYSQEMITENQVGQNIQIHSTILNENRKIQVYLPDDYDSTNKEYPVLYLLDGQRLYLHGVSLLQSFNQFQQTPGLIVVGINNAYPRRFYHFSSGAMQFAAFLTQEVVPTVNEKFRTSEERLLFGWEYAGSFAMQTMIDQPDLFDAYIASSPFPVNASDRPANQNVLPKIDSLFSKENVFDKFLYFSVSEGEGMVETGTDQLHDLLKQKAPESFNWTYRKLAGEEHRSTPYSTLYHAITSYYKYYPELQFKTLQEFNDAGGLEYVNEYYAKRAAQYGFPIELTTWTKFTIIRNAIRAKDFDQFDKLFEQLKSYEFIGSLKRSRPFEIAEFYEQHGKYEKAIEIYEVLIKTRPDSEYPLRGLGDAYTALGQKRKAASYYKQASKIQNGN